MPETAVVVDGLPAFNRSMRQLADHLDHLDEPHKTAGELVLREAQPPVVSGALKASGSVEATAHETTVVYGEVYSGVVHNGWSDRNIDPQPWLAESFDKNITAVVDVFVDDLNHETAKVKGV